MIWNDIRGMVNTTSIVNVATALARQGKSVLLVDVNSTCNLTRFAGVDYDIDERNQRKTMLDLLINVKDGCPISRSELVREAIIQSPSCGIDFIPGDKWMRAKSIGICKHNDYCSFMSTALETVDEYDYIIYDCTEFLVEETIMCMADTDDIYAPIPLEYFMSRGYKDTFELINYINNELKTNIEFKGIFLLNTETNMIQQNVSVMDSLEDLGGKIMSRTIRYCDEIVKAQKQWKDIYSYAPKSNGAKDYMELAKEIACKSDMTMKI